MKGDFTRSTFKPEKKYSSVRMQQGRVQLDADWNEQMDINSHRINTGTCDIIGLCGAPQDGGGFKISIEEAADQTKLTISPGRIYVDGILCENLKDKAIGITEQEDLPGYTLSEEEGVYLAYLDVWQRHVTSIEDPQIREVALGGPDTATRTKTVWQVKLSSKLENYVQSPHSVDGAIDCQKVDSQWKTIIEKSNGKLAAFTDTNSPGERPCIISPSAGYRRLENQLYRVEIHKGGDSKDAMFKWSRDNGSVVFAIDEFVDAVNGYSTKLKVRQLGRDKTLSLKEGDWVEVLDDWKELSDNPVGTLAQITGNPDVMGRVVTLNQPILKCDSTRHPKIRRWDQKSEAISVNPPSGSDYIELEGGVRVRFSGNSFRTGDYWLIPARTVTENTQETGKIEWPQDGSNNPIYQPPEGIVHHYCLLAVLRHDGNGNWEIISDCRKLFPALTNLTNLFYVCGDGQEAMPGEELPGSLQVGVANGKQLAANATVRFQITLGNGTVMSEDSLSKATGNGNDIYIEVPKSGDGIASCRWILDKDTQHQQVEATLYDACHEPINTPPIRFNANLSMAGKVAYKLPNCETFSATPGGSTLMLSNTASSLTLNRDSYVEIGQGMYFKVANTDASTLRYYVYKIITNPGDYEVRGEVASGTGGFTWNADNFAGFFYNLDKNISTESLKVSRIINGNVIPEYDIVYSTTIKEVNYKFENWGTYSVIGFFCESYVPLKPDDASKLAKLVLDSDDKHTLKTGETLDLGKGYTLEARKVDVKEKKVWLQFNKDGKYVDDEIISVVEGGKNTWEVKLDDIQDEDDVVVLKVHVKQVFQDEVDSIAQIEGLWLIDYANAITIESDSEFGTLTDVSIQGNTLTISNEDTFTLTKDSYQEIGQGMYFKVANTGAGVLRYYVYKIITNPGDYEVKGEVASGTGGFTWNADNFAGFFYNLDKNISTESLKVSRIINGNVIPVDGLVYSTTIKEVDYKFENWGTYSIIDFFCESYVPLKPDDASKLAKLVLDSDDKHTLKTGETLDLGKGYTLEAKQVDVDGEKVWLQLNKDGEIVDDDIISVVEGGKNTWEAKLDDIQDEDDVVVLKVHVKQVFQGAVDSIAQIEGLWLIDYANAMTLQVGDKFGELILDRISDDTTNQDIEFPTVNKLLKASWPSENEEGNRTVKGILDTLLCKLDAGKIPYNPLIKEDRWRDINEIDDLSKLTKPDTVQDAFDDLITNLNSSDIPYYPKNCGNAETPTVRSLLNISAEDTGVKDTLKVKDILDTLLCNLDAARLPVDRSQNSELCNILRNNVNVKTVQDALNLLCRERGGGGCCIVVQDEKELQKALDKLQDGSTICLLAGEYRIEKFWISARNNIIIRGCTPASVLIADISIEECSNVSIENLKIAGNVSVNMVVDFSLKKNTISPGFLSVRDCQSAVIESNILEVMEKGLEFYGSKHLKIHNNTIYAALSNFKDEGIFSSILVEATDDVEITGNTIHQKLGTEDTKGVTVKGIYLEKATGLKIKKNTVDTDLSILKEEGAFTSVNIDIVGTGDIEVTGNVVQMPYGTENIELKAFTTGIKIKSGGYPVLVSDNRINSVNGPSIKIQSNLELGSFLFNYSGSISVHGNFFTSIFDLLATYSTVEIICENRVIFVDNFCDTYSARYDSGENPGYTPFNLIQIKGIDTIFSNNHCLLRANPHSSLETAHVRISADISSVIGNRCNENISGENAYSIIASENSILLGNTTTNKISPSPNIKQLNLQDNSIIR